MLLAVDSSTKTVGVALYQEEQVLGEVIWYSRNYHTVELAPAVQYLMARSEVQPKDLKALAVALGPGSFTGLRIGLALVKGLAQGLNLPIIGVPTLDALAAAQPAASLPMAAVLQAGRGRLVVVWYKAENEVWKPQGDAVVMTAEELAQMVHGPTLICGEMSAEEQKIIGRKYRNAILASPAHSVRRPSFLAEIAWKRWKNGETNDPASLAPIYIHSGDKIEA